MALRVAVVRRSGWPGPEPARIMRPRLRLASRMAVLSNGFSSACRDDEEVSSLYACNMLSTSSSVIAASRRNGQYSQI